MKTTLIFLAFFCAYLFAPCQSAKEIKKNKIKSLTIWQTPKNSDNDEPIKESYEAFDKNGNSVLKIEYNPDGSIDKKETTRYDRNDNKIEEYSYEGEKTISSHKTYAYDHFQNRIEENEFLPNGTLSKKTVSTYNAKGDKLTETISDASGTVIKKIEYRFNTRNLKVQKITTNKTRKVEAVRKWGYEYY